MEALSAEAMSLAGGFGLVGDVRYESRKDYVMMVAVMHSMGGCWKVNMLFRMA